MGAFDPSVSACAGAVFAAGAFVALAGASALAAFLSVAGLAGDFVAGRAAAALVEADDVFLRDILDIRLPFVAFGGSIFAH